MFTRSTMLASFFSLLLPVAFVVGQVGPTEWTASPFNPSALPLAVKSPYVNAWAPLGNNSAAVSTAWPKLWSGDPILGWYASIRVDGDTFQLLGAADLSNTTAATQKSFTFTPTRSSYLLQAGKVNVNMSFLSPIEATDLSRLSMPFSYMYITAESNDGSSHDVQVYSDLSGEWITGDNNRNSNWTINESSAFVFLQMDLTAPGAYQEISNRPQDATIYHCIQKTDKTTTWQIANSVDIRAQFQNGTGLKNTAEAGSHAVDSPFDTLGLAVDLGTISATNDPVVFALGVVRDPVIQYTNINVQTEDRRAYYWSQFSNIHDVVENVLSNFSDALTASISLDSQILSDAEDISSDYADLLSLATRQAMSALEYTLIDDGKGNFNMSDVKAFMKDIGSVGSGGVNAVDVLYAAMPMYLYLNPNILGYLLSPLMEYQESTQYSNQYAAQDIGTAFPNATGNFQGHDQKIEQSANMLIMSLAHAQASGDGNLLAQHYNLLEGWANFLVNNTMSPTDQTTSVSDGILSNNQTNLVLKGIIGIGAMAKISSYTGHSNEQFSDIAKNYVQQWTTLASSSSELVLEFGGSNSGLIYNLYADKLLQLNLIDSSIYNLQTTFYEKQTTLSKFGVALDVSNSSSPARSDWMLFSAASTTNTTVRDTMISQVHAYASSNQENNPFAVLYYPGNGSQVGGMSSPAQGAMFAPLALNIPINAVSFKGAPSHKSNAAVIAGVTVGAIAFLAILGSVLFFFYRRRERKPKGMYNLKGRIERIKPATYPSDSVLEPLSATHHAGMHDLSSQPFTEQADDSFFLVGEDASKFSAITPFATYTGARSETRGYGSGAEDGSSAVLSRHGSSGLGSSSGPGSSWGAQAVSSLPLPDPKAAVVQEELRSEVDNLRREVEQLREDRILHGEAPPSYEEELALSQRR